MSDRPSAACKDVHVTVLTAEYDVGALHAQLETAL